MNIQGYCIVYKDTGRRWGGLFETEKGAISSFNKTRGAIFLHPVLGRRMYWHEQDVLEVKPLVIGE